MTDVELNLRDVELLAALSELMGKHEAKPSQILAGRYDEELSIIAEFRQAAEKAQQERDAVIVQIHAMRVSGMSEQYVRNGLATAIRSQGHE